MANKRPITTTGNLQEHPDADQLIAGQGNILAEQASSLGTPSSGYGVIYAKTDGKVYFKNDGGTEYDLTTAGGGGTNPVIREYTANDTWTKPTASNFWGALVICIGAGGGGGSGRRGPTGVIRSGGGAGGGGAFVQRFMRAATLTSPTYSITIGAGGNGGAAQTTDNTSGNAGTNGGQTSFGSLVIADKGNAGQGGGSSSGTAGAGGQASLCTPARGPYAIGGTQGGTGSTNGSTTQAGFEAITNGTGGPQGGSGGSGLTSGNTAVNGVAGTGVRNANTLINGGTQGTTAGSRDGGNGTNNAAVYLLMDINNATTNGVGTCGGSGAGGNAAGTVAGGNAGTSGNCVGGSGGGGSTNGANSGAGAAGGNGLCFVIEYYGS
jgi:hypothetical protein